MWDLDPGNWVCPDCGKKYQSLLIFQMHTDDHA